MRKRMIAAWIVVVMALGSLPAVTIGAAVPWEGEGTEASPYLITTVEEFNAIPDYSNIYFKLVNDLDFTGHEKLVTNFNGVFDGNGKTISNVTYTASSSNSGLFNILNYATIMDLTIENISVTTSSLTGATGGLAGTTSKAQISNVKIVGGKIDDI